MLRAWCLAHALCALATSRTVFQPDEHWQSLEIAHGIVFGYGYRTWEWTGKTPIRSIVHPASFVPLYAFLQACGLDASTFIMVCFFAHNRPHCLPSSRRSSQRSATHVRSASSNASPDAAPPGAGYVALLTPGILAHVFFILDVYSHTHIFEYTRGRSLQHGSLRMATVYCRRPTPSLGSCTPRLPPSSVSRFYCCTRAPY